MNSIYVIDIETTGLQGYPKDLVIEIAICEVNLIQKKVSTRFNSLVGHDTTQWDSLKKNAWIFDNSDITLELVQEAKSQQKVALEVQKILSGKIVTSYSTNFDFAGFLFYPPWSLESVVQEVFDCIMLSSANYCKIESEFGNYKFLTLAEAYNIICEGKSTLIKVQTHRALDDALMASYILLELVRQGHINIKKE